MPEKDIKYPKLQIKKKFFIDPRVFSSLALYDSGVTLARLFVLTGKFF
jgi:hypothetical protein